MERARVTLRVRRLHPERDGDLPLPRPMTVGAAGMDVVAAVEAPVSIAPGGQAAVPTGIAVAVPEGWELQVRPRSGPAAKSGLTVLNAPAQPAHRKGDSCRASATLGRFVQETS